MLARLGCFGYSLAYGMVLVGLAACQSALPPTPTATWPPPPTATVPPPWPTATPLPTAAPQTVPIRLAWFYKPPRDEAALPRLQTEYDVFILTRLDEPTREALRAAGAPGPFLQYLRFDAIHNPGSCTAQPNRNQVAYEPGDYCQLLADHPDWFLRDAAGEVLGAKDYPLMDPGHPAWHTFWLARAQGLQERYGWDGIFLDNIEASLNKRHLVGTLPAPYPDDAAYQTATLAFLAKIRASFEPQGRPLWGNVIAVEDPAMWAQYLNLLDGVMVEAFAVDWNTGYRSPESWAAQLAMVEETQVLGKNLILVAQGPQHDNARQTFALASYLLVAREKTTFRYTHRDHYNAEWWYPNYASALGPPRGSHYLVGEAWRRDFANGYVWVDPVAHEAQIVVQEK